MMKFANVQSIVTLLGVSIDNAIWRDFRAISSNRVFVLVFSATNVILFDNPIYFLIIPKINKSLLTSWLCDPTMHFE